MKFDIFLLPTVPGSMEDRERLRPIGRNRERVARMYDELKNVCRVAEQVGFDVFSTTEHHFHSEGFEVSTAPLVLYSHLAGLFKRIAFAPLALVLPTWDPIRCAEEVAVLDHLTRGRLYVGFARGYQPRWTQVLGQKYQVKGATMDGSEIDEQNRAVFDEVLEVILKAWTQETFQHDGVYYQAPFPSTGVEGWNVVELTQRYGARNELDEQGRIARVCVTPSCYQDPHPPLWQAYAASETTIHRCAQLGITPFIFISQPGVFLDWCRTYQRIAAESGRSLGLGEGVGAVRSITFGDSYEEAFELGVRTTGLTFEHYFGPFGFTEPFRRPPDPAAAPLNLGSTRALYARMVEDGYALCGTIDDVRRQMQALRVCHADGELEWFSWNFFFQGLTPWDEQERQLECFAKLIPEFRG